MVFAAFRVESFWGIQSILEEGNLEEAKEFAAIIGTKLFPTTVRNWFFPLQVTQTFGSGVS
jgi:hypothetical protein